MTSQKITRFGSTISYSQYGYWEGSTLFDQACDCRQRCGLMIHHINGTKNSDIRRATDQLHSLKLKSTQTIQENVATIEEAFRVLKVASGVPVTDDQKLYHLQEKLEHDARILVSN